MTMPSQEVRSLQMTREFLREILHGPRLAMRVLRERAADCLRHYPFDCHISARWSDDVCEHGDDRQFCPKCQAKGV